MVRNPDTNQNEDKIRKIHKDNTLNFITLFRKKDKMADILF